MPDRKIIKEMVLFLRYARDEWAQLAEQWDAMDNTNEARRTREQQEHCEREIDRLLAELPEDERQF